MGRGRIFKRDEESGIKVKGDYLKDRLRVPVGPVARNHVRRSDLFPAPGGSCPAEDALLATQNILLGAHALGLGTCLIGFAVSAMAKDPRIKDLLAIPLEESVHAVIAVGHPAMAYQRLAGRRKAVSRFVEP